MKINKKESTTMRPTELTPRTSILLSNLDRLHPPNHYVRSCYLYRFDGDDNIFDSAVLKTALGRTLVHFYPAAGRLKLDGQERIEIDCNGEGVLFAEAEADAEMDDLDYFDNPIPDHDFCPLVDRSQGMSACPLVLVQVTRFKCGGVCLGLAIHHHLVDGVSALHFIYTWSDIARGLDVKVPPFFDRHTILSARDPPQPKFTHIEYQTPPKMNISHSNEATQGASVFKKLGLTQYQMNALKANCKEGDENIRYSSYEVIVGHVWRCISMTYQLPKDQEMKLRMAIDGRGRLQPPLPQGFFGNVVFFACLVTLAGELYSNPVKFAVRRVHETLAQMDNDYLRSAIDYLELQTDRNVVSSNINDYECPNLAIISWNKLPFHDVDFGWGRPMYVGRAGIPPAGISHVLPTNDGSILFSITLPKEQMDIFERLFYDILNSQL